MPRERQITFGSYGHMLNRRQAISPDGLWSVYDTRNQDSDIARTDSIEMVNLDSGDIVRVYRSPSQSLYGPGVGAAAFHPHEQRVVFIHGLENCSFENPYSAARRFGAIVDVTSVDTETVRKSAGLADHEKAHNSSLQAAFAARRFVHAEARSVGDPSRTIGILNGGTHAHSWSHDGWISFTYNDAWLERNARDDASVRDLRTVGFMVPGMPTTKADQDGENFSGSFGAFLAANVCPNPSVGSDEIEQAIEECWIGTNGYIDHLENKHSHAIAFQGAVRDRSGQLIFEIFLVEIPNVERIRNALSQSTGSHRSELLKPLTGCIQRRLTHTCHREFPGVQGPRNWLISSPDGMSIYAPMRDRRGVVQLFRISTLNGLVEQITDMEHSIDGQISIDAGGIVCSFVCDQQICLVNVLTGKLEPLTNRNDRRLSGAVHFAGKNRVVFNRYVGSEPSAYLQVFVCERD